MTPWAGLVAAIIAGWIIRDPRRAAATALFPFLAVLAMQSWIIADGRAVSPPNTVTPFPQSAGYWLVQAVFLALAFGIAAELGALRRGRKLMRDAAETARRTLLASAVLAGLTVVFLIGYWLNSSPVQHHSANGAPPPQGTVGILLCVLTLAVLSVMTIRVRRATARRQLTAESSDSQLRASGVTNPSS